MFKFVKKREGIPSENSIRLYFHCQKCLDEAMALGIAPKAYSQLEAGATDLGIQIRCKRHDLNIIHIDFGGSQPAANTFTGDPDGAGTAH